MQSEDQNEYKIEPAGSIVMTNYPDGPFTLRLPPNDLNVTVTYAPNSPMGRLAKLEENFEKLLELMVKRAGGDTGFDSYVTLSNLHDEYKAFREEISKNPPPIHINW